MSVCTWCLSVHGVCLYMHSLNCLLCYVLHLQLWLGPFTATSSRTFCSSKGFIDGMPGILAFHTAILVVGEGRGDEDVGSLWWHNIIQLWPSHQHYVLHRTMSQLTVYHNHPPHSSTTQCCLYPYMSLWL